MRIVCIESCSQNLLYYSILEQYFAIISTILCTQEVLVYKYQQCSAWTLVSQRSFANPIHSILYLDVTGDGVREFVILTLRGVHILQVSLVLNTILGLHGNRN